MSELKEHLFCDCNEMFLENGSPLSNDIRPYYLKSEADKVIAHQKYKRCLAMARWCASRSASWCFDPADDELHKSDFYEKWKLRWRELAEKFKEGV